MKLKALYNNIRASFTQLLMNRWYSSSRMEWFKTSLYRSLLNLPWNTENYMNDTIKLKSWSTHQIHIGQTPLVYTVQHGDDYELNRCKGSYCTDHKYGVQVCLMLLGRRTTGNLWALLLHSVEESWIISVAIFSHPQVNKGSGGHLSPSCSNTTSQCGRDATVHSTFILRKEHVHTEWMLQQKTLWPQEIQEIQRLYLCNPAKAEPYNTERATLEQSCYKVNPRCTFNPFMYVNKV